jgi:hypothetical protein
VLEECEKAHDDYDHRQYEQDEMDSPQDVTAARAAA